MSHQVRIPLNNHNQLPDLILWLAQNVGPRQGGGMYSSDPQTWALDPLTSSDIWWTNEATFLIHDAQAAMLFKLTFG